jgi:hypothetical protein
MVKAGACDPWTNMTPTVPPIAAAAVPTIRSPNQSEHVAQAVESEGRAKVPLDQAGHEQDLAGVAESEDDGSPETPVTQEIARDAGDHRPDRHRQSCAWSNSDQDPGRHTRGRPEPGDVIRFGAQEKAELRRQEIGDGHCGCEHDSWVRHPLRLRSLTKAGTRSGEGLNLQLDLAPAAGGPIVLRAPKQEDEEA